MSNVFRKIDAFLIVVAIGFLIVKLFLSNTMEQMEGYFREWYTEWSLFAPQNDWLVVGLMLLYTSLLFLSKKGTYTKKNRIMAALAYGIFGYILLNFFKLNPSFTLTSLIVVPLMLLVYFARRRTNFLTVYTFGYFVLITLYTFLSDFSSNAIPEAKMVYILSDLAFARLHLGWGIIYVGIYTIVLFFAVSLSYTSRGENFFIKDSKYVHQLDRDRYYTSTSMYVNYTQYDNDDEEELERERLDAADMADQLRRSGGSRSLIRDYDNDAGRSNSESRYYDLKYDYDQDDDD